MIYFGKTMEIGLPKKAKKDYFIRYMLETAMGGSFCSLLATTQFPQLR